MEILIECKNIVYLRQERYRKVELLLQGEELRIYVYNTESEPPTVFVMIEPANESVLAQVQKLLRLD